MPGNKTVDVPEIELETLKLRLIGTAPMIQHPFSKTQMDAIVKKQTLGVKNKKARDPEQEYSEGLYKNSKDEIVLPIQNLKKCLVDACSFIEGLTKVMARGVIRVIGDEDGTIPIKYKKINRRTDVVRLSGIGRTADIRFRNALVDWSMDIEVQYNANMISEDQLVNLFTHAGFSVGLGDWRPTCNGNFGTFEVKRVK